MGETIREILITLLSAIVTTATPILTVYLGRYLSSLTKSETAERYIMEIMDAVTTAVLHTNQTLVDGLKKQGTFTPVNQNQALQLSTNKAKELLSNEAVSYLEKTHGNVASYLASKIEAEVKQQQG